MARGRHRADSRGIAVVMCPGAHSYSSYIGRVGALAVALGVGLWASTTPGVAFADTDSSNTSEAGADQSQADPVSESDTQATAPDSSEHSESSVTPPTENISTAVSESGATSSSTTISVGTSPEVVISSSGGADRVSDDDDETAPVDSEENEPAPTTAPPESTEPEAPEPDQSGTPPPADALKPIATGPDDTTVGDPNTLQHKVSSTSHLADDEVSSAEPQLNQESHAPSEPTAAVAFSGESTSAALVPVETSAEPVALAPRNPMAALAALPGVLIETAVSFVSAALAPLLSLAGLPGPMPDTPVMWGLLAWVRRQFANSTPTLDPGPGMVDPTTGLIYGDVGAVDADGDPLTFAVRQAPAHGAVTVDASGRYTYTPDPGYSGPDTFVISVSDASLGRTLGGLFRPGGGHLAATAITVTVPGVASTNQPPEVGPTPFTVTDTDEVSGAVTGHVNVNDTDPGDTLTYTVTPHFSPAVGAVTINPVTGIFTFTPTTEARENAWSAGEEDEASFTVAVSDGQADVHVVVTVPIAPLEPTTGNRAPVVGDPSFTIIDIGDSDNLGLVGGNINVTDPDQDALTFTLVSPPDPEIGAAYVDPETGFWAFAPTEQARQNAWENPDQATATFDVEVSDGEHTVTVSVIAPIDAASSPEIADPAFTISGVDPESGKVTGQVHASDADGDVPRFTVTGPPDLEVGTVKVDAHTGEWTFTPTNHARYNAFDGTGANTVEFTISVSDGVFVVPVAITAPISPVANNAPVQNPVAYRVTGYGIAPAVNDLVGGIQAIYGAVYATDPDQDTLTYRLATAPDPSIGTVEVDAKTGNWRFIPTSTARRHAWDTPAPDFANFAIAVSDGHRETTIDVVTPIPVAGEMPTFSHADPAVVAEIPLSIGNGDQSVTVSPDGTRMYLTGPAFFDVDGFTPFEDGQMRIWAINTTSNRVAYLIPHVGGDDIAVSKDGKYIYVSDAYLSGTTVVRVIQADGKRIDQYGGVNYEAEIEVSPSTHVPVFGEQSERTMLHISPDGRHLYVTRTVGIRTGSPQLVVSVVDTQTKSVVTHIDIDNAYYDGITVEMNDDGSRLYIAGPARGSSEQIVSIIHTDTNTVETVSFGTGVANFNFVGASPDEGRLYATGRRSLRLEDGTTQWRNVVLWVDPATQVMTEITLVTGRLDSNGYPVGTTTYPHSVDAELSSDGKYLYATIVTNNFQRNSQGFVSVVDTTTTMVTMQIDVNDRLAVGSSLGSIDISPDGTRLYVTGADEDGQEFVSVIGTATHSVIAEIPVGDRDIDSIQFSPNGDRLYLIGQRTDPQAPQNSIVRTMTTVMVLDTTKIADPTDPDLPPPDLPSIYAPDSYADLYRRLLEKTAGTDEGVSYEILRDGDDARIIVYLGGTTDSWGWLVDDETNQPMLENWDSYRGDIKLDQMDVIAEAVAKAPYADIMLVGYSQGGMDAQNIAAAGWFNVTSVVTFGAPIVQPHSDDYETIHLWDPRDNVTKQTFVWYGDHYEDAVAHDEVFRYVADTPDRSWVIPFLNEGFWAVHSNPETYVQVGEQFEYGYLEYTDSGYRLKYGAVKDEVNRYLGLPVMQIPDGFEFVNGVVRRAV